MRKLIYAIFILYFAVIIGSCSTPGVKIKPHPQYKGVDARLQMYLDQYMALSTRHNLTFHNKVTMGVKKINEGNVIGLCTYGRGWREIDIDEAFFSENSTQRQKILVFHELTHCFCSRGHDFNGVDYPSALTAFFERIKLKAVRGIPWCIDRNVPGYLSDGCPASIMHPYILDQQCIDLHYDYYIDEMFEACEPY